VHRILKSAGSERYDDGNCRLQKTEAQKLQNNQSIEVPTTYMNALSYMYNFHTTPVPNCGRYA
jgi:hypothetical protein